MEGIKVACAEPGLRHSMFCRCATVTSVVISAVSYIIQEGVSYVLITSVWVSSR
jgi:hypothetical protein